MDWGNFGGGSNRGRISEGNLHEIDEKGEYKNGDTGKRGRFGFGGRGQNKGGGRNYGSGGGGGKFKWIIALVCLGVVMFFLNEAGLFKNLTFSKDPYENFNSMVRSIEDQEKIVESNGSFGESVYDENNLYREDKVFGMPDNEYLVYFYTGDETIDSMFNEWVKEKEAFYKIYKLNIGNLNEYSYLKTEYIGKENRPFVVLMDGSGDKAVVEMDGTADKNRLPELLEKYDMLMGIRKGDYNETNTN